MEKMSKRNKMEENSCWTLDVCIWELLTMHLITRFWKL